MSEAYLYQIRHPQQSPSEFDSEFIELDNAANERPDWREYWPIRRFLLSERLDSESHYGFFSPNFRAATGLDAASVQAFIREHGTDMDVISFSPHFERTAFYLNIVEQIFEAKGDGFDTLKQCAALVAPGFQVDRSVTTSLNTIFYNFVVAKPAFWNEWLCQCERIFEAAEQGLTPLGRDLNRLVGHGAAAAPLKMFVIEQVSTLLLWSQRRWAVKPYDPARLAVSPTLLSSVLTAPDLIILDALKNAYDSSGFVRYLNLYGQLRSRFAERLAPTARRDGATASPASKEPLAPGPGPSAVRRPDPVPIENSNPIRIRVVSATRQNREAFFSSSALGRSLSIYRPPAVEVRLFPNNVRGLAEVYNEAIAEAFADDLVLVFVHDDVHLYDFNWADGLRRGLNTFDVLGLAGNRRRVAGQPGWLFTDERLTRDSRDNLSGVIAHGCGFPPDSIDVFGAAGQEVKLLDGVLLAVTSTTLRAKSLRFDERFDFHFYDLDFCRQAERAGLRMGTWPISVMHESKGNFASGWRQGYETYLDKWQD